MPLPRPQRQLFDRILHEEVAKLPAHFAAALDETPLIIEDEPAPELLEELGMGEDEDLCGLHTGTPLTERGASFDLDFPDRLMLFRGPIMGQAGFPDDGGAEDDLRREIRITLLHEMGHHFGLGEEDLETLGYG